MILTGFPNGSVWTRAADRADHRPALPRAQGSVSRLTDQLVTEQGDLVGPLGPPSLLLIDQRHL
ncbi:hypothetical protein [Streptomyces fagopyri]|uniref:hypothetical protein n=1 Tax=Streptomyces fagopyri TaxID=2662397 RepID=UPI001D1705CB|nr:hypothetical protein [Streptomyces fagopyri]